MRIRRIAAVAAVSAFTAAGLTTAASAATAPAHSVIVHAPAPPAGITSGSKVYYHT